MIGWYHMGPKLGPSDRGINDLAKPDMVIVYSRYAGMDVRTCSSHSPSQRASGKR